MILELVTSPETRIVSLANVKQDINVDTSAYDDKILRLIMAAEVYFDGRDGIIGRCFRSQQWKMSIPNFEDFIRLPLPPTRSVDLVEYYDEDEVLQTLSDGYYQIVDGGSLGDAIIPVENTTYPDTEERPDAVQITFTAGYDVVPEAIQLAVTILVRSWYDDPGADVPEVVRTLIAPYRLNRIG